MGAEKIVILLEEGGYEGLRDLVTEEIGRWYFKDGKETGIEERKSGGDCRKRPSEAQLQRPLSADAYNALNSWATKRRTVAVDGMPKGGIRDLADATPKAPPGSLPPESSMAGAEPGSGSSKPPTKNRQSSRIMIRPVSGTKSVVAQNGSAGGSTTGSNNSDKGRHAYRTISPQKKHQNGTKGVSKVLRQDIQSLPLPPRNARSGGHDRSLDKGTPFSKNGTVTRCRAPPTALSGIYTTRVGSTSQLKLTEKPLPALPLVSKKLWHARRHSVSMIPRTEPCPTCGRKSPEGLCKVRSRSSMYLRSTWQKIQGKH